MAARPVPQNTLFANKSFLVNEELASPDCRTWDRMMQRERFTSFMRCDHWHALCFISLTYITLMYYMGAHRHKLVSVLPAAVAPHRPLSE
jgi:hypothetical protein